MSKINYAVDIDDIVYKMRISISTSLKFKTNNDVYKCYVAKINRYRETIDKPGPHFGSILIHHTHMQTDIVMYRQFHL